MELSKEQIQEIENYLDVKEVIYIDIRFEVFDHIILDIETKLKSENLTFEKAFCKVKKKWNQHFDDSTSFLFGIFYSAPKLMLEKVKSIFKPYYFGFISLYFIPFVFFEETNIQFPEKWKPIINISLRSILIIAALVIIFIFYKSSKTTIKTTYSFILKTQQFGVVLALFPVLSGSYFDLENNLLNSSHKCNFMVKY